MAHFSSLKLTPIQKQTLDREGETMEYTVYYQTGGTDNFKWHRLDGRNLETAKCDVTEICRGGRPAHYELTSLINAIGLPDTFEDIK